MAGHGPIPTEVRVAVDARDRRLCVRCGARSRALHHRRRRREGGHGFDVVISCCNACHRYIHANPAEAKENGWIVSAYQEDPSSVPMKTWRGWVLLGKDGSVSFRDASADA